MLKIYGAPLSPFVRKALLVLDHKGLEYEVDPVLPHAESPAFQQASPLGKIPALVDDAFSVPDTSIICRYLDRKYPDKPIYPSDPRLEAKACWIEEFADTRLVEACGGLFAQRLLNPKLLNKPTDEAVVKEILDNKMPAALSYLQSLVSDSPYLVGDAMTIADVSIMTCFIQAQYASFEMDASQFPALRKYFDHWMASPLVSNRLADEKTSSPF